MADLNVANYVQVDGDVYAGDTHDGNVYVATVPEGESFKYANWSPATMVQVKNYWAQRKLVPTYPILSTLGDNTDICAETGESVFFCTCGWH